MMSRAERRSARSAEASARFGAQSGAALDALDLLDLAWHDCYGEPAPPDGVMDDIWTVAGTELALLVSAAHLAVVDRRDLHVNADAMRGL